MAFPFTGTGIHVEREEYEDSKQNQEDQSRKKESYEYADKKLKSLVSSHEMYVAMENFLLGNPERQILALGDLESVLQVGKEAKSKDDLLGARTNFETAAKLELYKQHKDGLRDCLILSQDVTDESDKHFGYQRTILDNTDEALHVAKVYYEKIPGTNED
ncbi:MAG: hypothetical protein PXY39_03970 [archaeon]|nr:hypothetical protein [archaeon]